MSSSAASATAAPAAIEQNQVGPKTQLIPLAHPLANPLASTLDKGAVAIADLAVAVAAKTTPRELRATRAPHGGLELYAPNYIKATAEEKEERDQRRLAREAEKEEKEQRRLEKDDAKQKRRLEKEVGHDQRRWEKTQAKDKQEKSIAKAAKQEKAKKA